MANYLLITIDTEPDSAKWKPEFPPSLENIKALPRLQNLFDKYRIRPTYLLTYSVATDKESKKILRSILEQGKAEIGSHLHPWDNPPFSSEKEKRELSYPNNSQFEFEKLSILTGAIEEFFGEKPKSYRAGRYGFDRESLKFLEELGYLVDSSQTPTLNWSFDGGPDFSNLESTQPYYLGSILEAPISVIINRKLPKKIKKIYKNLSPQMRTLFKKTGLIKTIWLRPSISSFPEMKELSDSLLKSENKVLNMMFHSNELISGASPYIRTEKKVENFFWKLEKILDYLIRQKELGSKTLSELINEYPKL